MGKGCFLVDDCVWFSEVNLIDLLYEYCKNDLLVNMVKYLLLRV